MDRYIPRELHILVVERANYLCEYCLIHEDDTFVGCQVDHIISLKHGGQGVLLKPLTDIGEATVRILRFNDSERILERETLIAVGDYPSLQALARMRK